MHRCLSRLIHGLLNEGLSVQKAFALNNLAPKVREAMDQKQLPKDNQNATGSF